MGSLRMEIHVEVNILSAARRQEGSYGLDASDGIGRSN